MHYDSSIASSDSDVGYLPIQQEVIRQRSIARLHPVQDRLSASFNLFLKVKAYLAGISTSFLLVADVCRN